MADRVGSSMPQHSSSRQEEARSTPTWGRQLRQLGFYFAGAGLMAASVAVSRRAVIRRQRDCFPKFYSSNRDGARFDSSDRSLMAVQALGLATLNVMSFGVLLVGGTAWAFDLSSLSELRSRSQAVIRRNGVVNPEDEAQMEEMMGDLLKKLGMENPEASEEGKAPKKD